MKIRQGDIFLQNGQVYVVEKKVGRLVYLTTILRDESVMHGIAYFGTTLKTYFFKLNF